MSRMKRHQHFEAMFREYRGAKSTMYGSALLLTGIFLILLSVPLRSRRHTSTSAGAVVRVTESPPNREELGRGGWTLIHTTAANYAEKPNEEEKKHANAFFRSLGALYPCKLCRDHFDRFIAIQPPEYVCCASCACFAILTSVLCSVSSRDKLLLWTCIAHNEVNERNGKPVFPCAVKELDKRWGDCGCTS